MTRQLPYNPHTDETPTKRTTFRRTVVRYAVAITEEEFYALNLLPDYMGWSGSLPSLDTALFNTRVVGSVAVASEFTQGGPFIYFSILANHDTFAVRREIAEVIEAFCDEAVAKRKAMA